MSDIINPSIASAPTAPNTGAPNSPVAEGENNDGQTGSAVLSAPKGESGSAVVGPEIKGAGEAPSASKACDSSPGKGQVAGRSKTMHATSKTAANKNVREATAEKLGADDSTLSQKTRTNSDADVSAMKKGASPEGRQSATVSKIAPIQGSLPKGESVKSSKGGLNPDRSPKGKKVPAKGVAEKIQQSTEIGDETPQNQVSSLNKGENQGIQKEDSKAVAEGVVDPSTTSGLTGNPVQGGAAINVPDEKEMDKGKTENISSSKEPKNLMQEDETPVAVKKETVKAGEPKEIKGQDGQMVDDEKVKMGEQAAEGKKGESLEDDPAVILKEDQRSSTDSAEKVPEDPESICEAEVVAGKKMHRSTSNRFWSALKFWGTTSKSRRDPSSSAQRHKGHDESVENASQSGDNLINKENETDDGEKVVDEKANVEAATKTDETAAMKDERRKHSKDPAAKKVVGKKDAEQLAAKGQDISEIGPEKQDSDTTAAEKQDPDMGAVKKQDTDSTAAKKQDPEMTATEEQDADTTAARKQDSDTTAAEKQDTDMGAVKKQDTDSTAAKKRDSEMTAAKKLDTEATPAKKLDTDVKAAKKQDSDTTAAKKLDTETAPAKKLDTDVKAAKKQDSDTTAAKKQDIDTTAAKKQDTDTTAAKKQDTDSTAAKKLDTEATPAKKLDTDMKAAKKQDSDTTAAKKQDTDMTAAKKQDTDTTAAKKQDSDTAKKLDTDAKAAQKQGTGPTAVKKLDTDEAAAGKKEGTKTKDGPVVSRSEEQITGIQEQ